MTEHALYRFYDHAGQLLYVGITSDPGRRWKQHRHDKAWWHDVARITIEQHPDRATVEAAELVAIRSEHPLHNIQHNNPQPPGCAARDDEPPLTPGELRAIELSRRIPGFYGNPLAEWGVLEKTQP